jgi:DNA-binding transcriptional MerR regulator
MAKDEIRFGGGSFQQLTGCRSEHVRILEIAGLIRPSKSDSGFRQFSAADVAAARRWMSENARRRKRA